MKRSAITGFAMVIMIALATTVMAQPGGERGGRGGQGRGGPGGQRGGMEALMRAMPLMMALDADRNGEISAKEIEGAVAALKKLDKNEDGKLTADELRPQRGGPGGEGAGRPGQGGGAGGMVERMMAMDTDGDGRVSKDEAPERMQAFFDRLDDNKDGFIDKKEIEEMASRFGGGRGGRGGDGGGAGRGGRGGGGGGPTPPRRPPGDGGGN